jgi:hypothetical protein
MITSRTLFAALVLTATVAIPAAAQTNPCTTSGCAVTDKVSLKVNPLVRLSLSQTTTALNSPDTTAYDAGSSTTAGPTVSVKANRSWSLTVKAGAATFTPALGASGYNKPAGDLGVKIAGGSTVAGLSTTAASLASGTSGGVFSGAVTYTTKFDWTKDIPDDYTMDVVYTITAP